METMTGPAKGETVMRAPSKKDQIVTDIRARIRSGDLRPGDQIPTSSELRSLYGVSLVPVRAAIAELKTLGLVEFAAGRGVFVADHPPV